MILAAILVGLILVGLIVLACVINTTDVGDMGTGLLFGVLISLFFIVETGIVSDIIEEPEPTPMDVYQGKTTLKYTIIDGIKIDSCVIFKKK